MMNLDKIKRIANTTVFGLTVTQCILQYVLVLLFVADGLFLQAAAWLIPAAITTYATRQLARSDWWKWK